MADRVARSPLSYRQRRRAFLWEEIVDLMLELLIPAVVLTGVGFTHQAGSPAQPGHGPFRARAVSHTATIRLKGPVDKVFPLFGPLREAEWAAGWSPQLVHPTDSEVAEGMVFKTVAETRETFWVIVRYDVEQRTVAYANVTPNYMVNRILITCATTEDGKTAATVTYWHVALSEQGNDFIRHMDEKAYAAKMAHWRQAIDYRLETGKAIPVQDR
jgi:hypothetical protein